MKQKDNSKMVVKFYYNTELAQIIFKQILNNYW